MGELLVPILFVGLFLVTYYLVLPLLGVPT
jgi:hypothetical protein